MVNLISKVLVFVWSYGIASPLFLFGSDWDSDLVQSIENSVSEIQGTLSDSDLEAALLNSKLYEILILERESVIDRFVRRTKEDEEARAGIAMLVGGGAMLAVSSAIQDYIHPKIRFLRSKTKLMSQLLKSWPKSWSQISDTQKTAHIESIVNSPDIPKNIIHDLQKAPQAFREAFEILRSDIQQWKAIESRFVKKYGPELFSRVDVVINGPQGRILSGEDSKFFNQVELELFNRFGRESQPFIQAFRSGGLRGLGDLKLRTYRQAFRFASSGPNISISQARRHQSILFSQSPALQNFEKIWSEIQSLIIESSVGRISLADRSQAFVSSHQSGLWRRGRLILERLGQPVSRWERARDLKIMRSLESVSAPALDLLEKKEPVDHIMPRSHLPGESLRKKKQKKDCRKQIKKISRFWGLLAAGVGVGSVIYSARKEDPEQEIQKREMAVKYFADKHGLSPDIAKEIKTKSVHLREIEAQLASLFSKPVAGNSPDSSFEVVVSPSMISDGDPITGFERTLYVLIKKRDFALDSQLDQRSSNAGNGLLLRFHQVKSLEKNSPLANKINIPDEFVPSEVKWEFSDSTVLQNDLLAKSILGTIGDKPFDPNQFDITKARLAFQ